MAQSNTSNPQVSPAELLVRDILDINDKSNSLLDLCYQADSSRVRNGAAVRIASPLSKAVPVLEGAELTADAEMEFSLAEMTQHKFGNRVSYTTQWEEDSMASAREMLSRDIIRSHQRASDEVVIDELVASTAIPEVSAASLAGVSLSNILDAASSLRWQGMLPNLYCSWSVLNQLKNLELANGVLSDPAELLGLTWIPCDIPEATESGDLLLMVGDISKELVAADKGLRVSVDTQSSITNALSGKVAVFSYQELAVGAYGSGAGLTKITLE